MARRIGLRRRKQVIARDGKLCYLCGRLCIVYPQNNGFQRDHTLTLDHVQPLASWGLGLLEGEELEAALQEANHPDNLAVSCAECNVTKDDLMPADDYMESCLHLLGLHLQYGVPLR